jgi:TRAP-type uncharacterized transport system fused permease subunit
VALAAFAAAAIAKTPPMATAVESTRVGIAKYLVPFAFVYNPALLLVGPTWISVASTALAVAGLWVLSTGLEGWYRGRLNPAQRIAALGAAALVLLPPTVTIAEVDGFIWNAGGLAVAAVLLGPRLLRRISAPRAAVGLGEGTGR